MRKFVLISILLLSCGWASAQHDLYKWQLSGYTGMANYFNQENSTVNYFEIDNNLLHRLELTRNIGYGFGVSVNSSFGSVRGFGQQRSPFTTDLRMASVRAYFHTDNGWLLNNSAWVAPFFFGGYGLGIFETLNGSTIDESRYVPTIPFGAGLKFRLAERWQLSVQTEVLYPLESHLQAPTLEQNDLNNAFWHTGLTLGYSFGFRQSTFKAPRFYADNVALLQSVEGLNVPRQNALEAVLKLEPKRVQLENSPDSVSLERLARTERTLASPADTLSVRRVQVEVDSSLVRQPDAALVTPVRPDTRRRQTDNQTGRRVAATAAPSSETVTIDTIVVVRTVRRSAATVQERDPAGTAVPRQPAANVQRITIIDTATVRQPATVQGRVIRDTVAVSQPSTTRQPAATSQQRAQARPAPANTRTAPIRVEGPERVVEREIYLPNETNRAPIQPIVMNTEQVREERMRLESANAANKRLQSRVDSLQAAQRADTLATTTGATADSSLVQYLQQQAALNDSMLRRLNQYEQELARLTKANAAPVSQPAAEAPKSFTTTVFFPINSHSVPPESLNDLKEALQVLRANPDWKARLTGYTDQSGNAAYNMALSRKRVEALVDFMEKQGIARDRINTDNLGDTKSTQKVNPLDRKVEIRITE